MQNVQTVAGAVLRVPQRQRTRGSASLPYAGFTEEQILVPEIG